MEPIEVGPWAKEKLDALEKYLRAYTLIMSKQIWCKGFVYIDAFAGPGTHVVRRQYISTSDQQLSFLADYQSEAVEHIEFLRGSPRVALDVTPKFSVYVFVEQDPHRIKELELLKSEYPRSTKILIRNADCNQYLNEHLIHSRDLNWREWRALIFLDPFGMQVPWETLAGLASTKGVEVLINFPVGMAIQRLLRRDGNIDERFRDKLNSYFGTTEWYNVIYQPTENLFGPDQSKIEESGHKLVHWYRSNRLQSVFKHVSPAKLVRNTRGGHLYYLIHATQNAKGAKIAKHVLSQGESID